MTKLPTTKRETRAEINAQIEEFLKSKGEITQANMGESGLVDGKYNTSHVGFTGPKQTRTPLNYVVATLALRKQQKYNNLPKTTTNNSPKRKVIYDDFGDPIRWVWEE
ncbi:hypothetical protein [Marinomonas sp. 2405UD68-3]|uniref:hypothetical protein n=1 Tax=Marinomonas sp. 2405UD68-3 TaxID=3391835 RepID=UPI0039C98710